MIHILLIVTVTEHLRWWKWLRWGWIAWLLCYLKLVKLGCLSLRDRWLRMKFLQSTCAIVWGVTKISYRRIDGLAGMCFIHSVPSAFCFSGILETQDGAISCRCSCSWMAAIFVWDLVLREVKEGSLRTLLLLAALRRFFTPLDAILNAA